MLARTSQVGKVPACIALCPNGQAVLNGDRLPHLDRVADRILAPLEPTAVVDGDPRPIHQVRVEPGLARAPAGAAVEGDPLVGGDARVYPVRRDLRVGPHRVVDVAVVLHVVRIRTAVSPDVAGGPAISRWRGLRYRGHTR